MEIIEDIAEDIINFLKEQGLSTSSSDFLLDHAIDVHSKIKDEQIQKIDLFFG